MKPVINCVLCMDRKVVPGYTLGDDRASLCSCTKKELETLRNVIRKLSLVLKLARNAFCDRECDGRGHSLNCRTLRATLLSTRD